MNNIDPDFIDFIDVSFAIFINFEFSVARSGKPIADLLLKQHFPIPSYQKPLTNLNA